MTYSIFVLQIPHLSSLQVLLQILARHRAQDLYRRKTEICCSTKLAVHLWQMCKRHHSNKFLLNHCHFTEKHCAMPIISAEAVSGEWVACVLESICHSVLASRLKRVTYACHGCPDCLSDQPWGDSDASCLSSSVAQKTCNLSTNVHVRAHATTHTRIDNVYTDV